jgi:hypothetical protein
MLAQEGEASIGPLSIQGATFTVLIVLLGYGLFLVAEKIIHLEEEVPLQSKIVIHEYFELINKGITGEKESFSEAWELFTPSYQTKKSEKYAKYGYSLPEEYSELYTKSGHHDVLACKLSSGSEEAGHIVYYVVFRLTENHWNNPYYNYFSPPTNKRLENIPELLTKESIQERLRQELSKHYIIPDDFDSEAFSKRIEKTYFNRLISPRLLTEIAADFKLSERNKPFESIGADGDTYRVYEGNKIHLKKVDGRWKIDAFKIATFCGHRADI